MNAKTNGENQFAIQTAMEEAAARALAAFRQQRSAHNLSSSTTSELSHQAVANFLNCAQQTAVYLRDAITLLCEVTALEDPALAQPGLEALFPSLIERLNDSFEPEACALYDCVFAQVIDYYRRLPEGQRLDEELRRFGLMHEQDLLARKSRLKQAQQISKQEWRMVKKVLILSRVTLGADVVVSSVMMAQLHEVYPEAEIVLLGSRKLEQLFGSDKRVRVREVAYQRGSGVMARLMSWLEVVKAVEEETSHCEANEWVMIDPDSRLTQLGLLPVSENDERYFFFESRSYRQPGIERLGQLAAHWIGELTRSSGEGLPYVALPEAVREFGQQIGRKARAAGASHLISVSLGVGGNERKRITDAFESKLIQALLNHAAVILDKGATVEEREQVNRIVAMMKSQGKRMLEIDEQSAANALQVETINADIITWDGSIGMFAGLIAASNEYIGYDSAGQHIAAALGVPTLTIFAKTDAPLFAQRWQPYGSGPIEVIHFDPSQIASGHETTSGILERVLAGHHRLIKNNT